MNEDAEMMRKRREERRKRRKKSSRRHGYLESTGATARRSFHGDNFDERERAAHPDRLREGMLVNKTPTWIHCTRKESYSKVDISNVYSILIEITTERYALSYLCLPNRDLRWMFLHSGAIQGAFPCVMRLKRLLLLQHPLPSI